MHEEFGRLLWWVACLGRAIKLTCARGIEPHLVGSVYRDAAWFADALFQLAPLADAVRLGDIEQAIEDCDRFVGVLRDYQVSQPQYRSDSVECFREIEHCVSLNEGIAVVESLKAKLVHGQVARGSRRAMSGPVVTLEHGEAFSV